MELFSHAMHKALYGKEGYYHKAEIGKHGDFYTSVSIGELFGCVVGHYIQQLFTSFKFPHTVIEIGAYKGYFIADIMKYLYRFHPATADEIEFVIIEPLESLRKKQQNYFDKLGLHIRIISTEEAFDMPLFIANELLDCMPCDVVTYQNHEFKIALIDSKQLYFVPRHALDSKNAEYAEHIFAIAQQFNISHGEIPLSYQSFFHDILTKQQECAFLFFDYGSLHFCNTFSLRFYKDKAAFNFTDFLHNPQAFLNNADITYDVAFEYVQSILAHYQTTQRFYGRQSSILISMGLDTVFTNLTNGLNPTHKAYIHYASMLKSLIAPTLFGERFKCAFYATKNLDYPFKSRLLS